MDPIKDQKDWMREFRPALDAALSCPDVAPSETVELYFRKIIEYERLMAAKILCSFCRREGKPDHTSTPVGLWSHLHAIAGRNVRETCTAWELWESWEYTLK